MDFTPVAIEAAWQLNDRWNSGRSLRTEARYWDMFMYAMGYRMALLHNQTRSEDWAKGRHIVDVPMEAGK